ncbi:hypothetical protein BOSEA31B_12264 [Hyphomicrobiales bacterium]|nr:hypothetical protein BOSEA31B_12264 [Hyphomicrobiales bacterium]
MPARPLRLMRPRSRLWRGALPCGLGRRWRDPRSCPESLLRNRVVIPGLTRNPSEGSTLYDGSRFGAAPRLVRDDGVVPCKMSML